MPEVQHITRFRFDGKEYNNITSIKTEVENRIGRIIDYADVTLTPSQRLSIHHAICKNKEELSSLLNVTYTPKADSIHGSDEINVLDM